MAHVLAASPARRVTEAVSALLVKPAAGPALVKLREMQEPPVSSAPDLRLSALSLGPVAASPAACRAFAENGGHAARPRMREVVELVMLLKMPPTLPLEQEQEFLDHLYTLQYHYRHVLATSLGRVFSKVSDGYTHGVVFRLPSSETLDAFLAHPALNTVLEKYVDPFCQAKFSLSFRALVEDELEAVFRRGDDFESGVEHLVFVRPKEGVSEAQKEDMLAAVRELPNKVGPSVVQLTAGTVLGAHGSPAFSHALIVRLPSEEDLTTYNRHPAHREVIRKHLLPIAERILSVDFSVDPVGQERPV